MIVLVFGLLVLASVGSGLDNGLGLTPPMGWLSWQRFRCQTDCQNFPDDCVSEKLMQEMATAMVNEGYKDLGYEYVIIDDCWMTHERDQDGKLVADPDRFPSGIPALADYIHNLGLKFGIYEDLGVTTCGGFPGSIDHKEIDANTFAEWGIDYVKFDGCASDPADFDTGYPEFGDFLNKTGRPIFYSCEWPLYQMLTGIEPNYTAIRQSCNMWRNYYDIDDSYDSYIGTVNWYGDNQEKFADFAGPGGWNDPDMIVIGNFALSFDQSKAQMALWAVIASPLIMSNDLRAIDPQMKAILQNKDIIAVNQDRLGKQGKRVYNNDGIQVWVRPIEPVINNQTSYAVAVISTRIGGNFYRLRVPIADLQITGSSAYSVTDLYSNIDGSYGIKADEDLIVDVNPTGGAIFKFETSGN